MNARHRVRILESAKRRRELRFVSVCVDLMDQIVRTQQVNAATGWKDKPVKITEESLWFQGMVLHVPAFVVTLVKLDEIVNKVSE